MRFAGEIPSVRIALGIHIIRKMAPPVALVALYTVVAALVVRWDMERCGEATRGLGEELYGMYMQVFFQPAEPLPQAPVARFVFWITPIVGAVLLAEGVLKIGATLLDPEARLKLWVQIMSERMMDHVVVCGLGHVGYRVVEALQKLGEPVVAIERKEDSFVESVRAMGIPVIVGDARRDELLLAAGIERARSVVCATNDDLANLEIAIDGKRMNPDIRVVMRMFDQRVASKVGGALELDETFSTSALAAPLVALQATEDGVLGVYAIGEGSLHVTAEISVGRRARERTVQELEEAFDVRVIRMKGAAKGDRPVRVKGAETIHPGAVLVVDVGVADLAGLRAALS
ncbi:MAG TPA: NAD-binding protein [Polyangiaceae bacterium]|nr:NAD-binding protein [Polyangiaceae bacterium]